MALHSATIRSSDTKAEVARVFTIRSAQDLQDFQSLIQSQPHVLGQVAIMDARDWSVIPAENLVALIQAVPACRLLAVATSPAEALVMMAALELGTDGVLLRTERPQDVAAVVSGLAALAPQRIDLQAATITKVTLVGQGDRVCVDLASMMQPGEGCLIGSFASMLFLVHSECEETSYIASRPFRVNAGAVHSYMLGPSGRTSYLSELRAGSVVAVADPAGNLRNACVGRNKLERRPLVLIEAELADGRVGSVMLQNAETVKLVQGGTLEEGQPRSSQAISVATIKPGDQVRVHVPGSGARHMGIAVKGMTVAEQ